MSVSSFTLYLVFLLIAWWGRGFGGKVEGHTGYFLVEETAREPANRVIGWMAAVAFRAEEDLCFGHSLRQADFDFVHGEGPMLHHVGDGFVLDEVHLGVALAALLADQEVGLMVAVAEVEHAAGALLESLA